jgi:hypothetical protein
VGTARFSFSSTFEGKGVPEAWQPILKERLARYDFSNHGVEECGARLRQVAEEAGLDGCWCSLSAMTPDKDVVNRVRTTGEALQSLTSFE